MVGDGLRITSYLAPFVFSTENEHDHNRFESVIVKDTPDLPLTLKSTPPDGGFITWLQCIAAFCISFNTWGLLTSFGKVTLAQEKFVANRRGAFQLYYETDLLKTSTSSQISWIGTVQSSFIFFGALYAGPLYDAGYLRYLSNIGSFLIVIGMLMTSFCKEY